jgi:hypothetical protein
VKGQSKPHSNSITPLGTKILDHFLGTYHNRVEDKNILMNSKYLIEVLPISLGLGSVSFLAQLIHKKLKNSGTFIWSLVIGPA